MTRIFRDAGTKVRSSSQPLIRIFSADFRIFGRRERFASARSLNEDPARPMMSQREYQRDLMDVSPQVARKMEADSIYRILHEVGPSLLRDEDFAEMYAEDGRPSHQAN